MVDFFVYNSWESKKYISDHLLHAAGSFKRCQKLKVIIFVVKQRLSIQFGVKLACENIKMILKSRK